MTIWKWVVNCVVWFLHPFTIFFNISIVCFIKTTFAYFTQFSPVWAFIPLKLVYDSCVEFLNSNDTQDVTDGIDVQGVENE